MEFMDAKKAKTLKDVEDTIQKINEIQKQIDYPDRDGMIEALRDAQTIALVEIRAIEISQRQLFIVPAEQFTNQDLYNKLFQYRQALVTHGAAIVGKEAFEEHLKHSEKLRELEKE